MNQIRSKAKVAGNPGVYTLAQIDGPSIPTPAAPPGKPFDLKFQIASTGTLILKWKNSNARDCSYFIDRRLSAAGDFVRVATVGKKQWTDTNLPAGTAQVQYRICALRSTGVSDWALLVVNLGVEPGMVQVIQNTPQTNLLAA